MSGSCRDPHVRPAKSASRIGSIRHPADAEAAI